MHRPPIFGGKFAAQIGPNVTGVTDGAGSVWDYQALQYDELGNFFKAVPPLALEGDRPLPFR
jgi:hypothetical protein